MRRPYEVQNRILYRLRDIIQSINLKGLPGWLKELCYEQCILRMPGGQALKVTRKKCITKSCFFEKNSNTEQRITRFCCDFMRRKVDVCLCMDAINPVEKRTSLLLWIGMTCPWKHALSRLTQLTPKGTLRFPKMFKTSGFPCNLPTCTVAQKGQ